MIKYGYEFPDDPSEETRQDPNEAPKPETPKKKPTKESNDDLRNDDN